MICDDYMVIAGDPGGRFAFISDAIWLLSEDLISFAWKGLWRIWKYPVEIGNFSPEILSGRPPSK